MRAWPESDRWRHPSGGLRLLGRGAARADPAPSGPPVWPVDWPPDRIPAAEPVPVADLHGQPQVHRNSC